MRIVSLLPSATEALYALGAESDVVGVSHDSDYPPEVRAKPIVSSTVIDDAMSSSAIDQAVGDADHAGASIYHIDPAFLERQRPDLIVAQELCQVCAITSAEARRAAELARSGARILSLEPTTLTEALDSLLTLGHAAGRAWQAEQLVAGIRGRIAAVAGRLGGVTWRPRVLCLGWMEPLIVEGHWFPELVKAAGGRDELGQVGAHSRRLAPGEIAAYAPDVIAVVPCSFNLARTLAEIEVLGTIPGWDDLPAVRAGRVYALDSGYFSRPGPRLAAGIEILARCFHPSRFAAPLPPGAAAVLAPSTRPSAGAFEPLT